MPCVPLALTRAMPQVPSRTVSQQVAQEYGVDRDSARTMLDLGVVDVPAPTAPTPAAPTPVAPTPAEPTPAEATPAEPTRAAPTDATPAEDPTGSTGQAACEAPEGPSSGGAAQLLVHVQIAGAPEAGLNPTLTFTCTLRKVHTLHPSLT